MRFILHAVAFIGVILMIIESFSCVRARARKDAQGLQTHSIDFIRVGIVVLILLAVRSGL